MSKDSPWRLDGGVATLQTSDFSARLQLASPSAGLTELCWRGEPISGRLWGWTAQDLAIAESDSAPSTTPACSDAYVRGGDLVLTYAATDACPFETQLYWVACVEEASVRLSLVVSIKTSLLDTRPVVWVRSTRDAQETLIEPGGAAGAVLHRLSGGGSFIEACHPADETQLRGESGDSKGKVEWRLFDHFLEKGVIRRARLTALPLAREDDSAAAVDALGRFLAEPTPLTV